MSHKGSSAAWPVPSNLVTALCCSAGCHHAGPAPGSALAEAVVQGRAVLQRCCACPVLTRATGAQGTTRHNLYHGRLSGRRLLQE